MLKENELVKPTPRKTPVSREVFRGRPFPGKPAPSVRVEGSMPTSVQVKYKPRTKRITLERFLASKIVFFREEVSFQDILVLYDNLLWCQDKAEKDPSFREKFGRNLELLTKILKEFRFNSKRKSKTLVGLSERLKSELEEFLIPKRNLLGTERHLRGRYVVLASVSPGRPKRALPPVARIGIGYRDKGTLRNLARDGSPSWQEVATSIPVELLEELQNENG